MKIYTKFIRRLLTLILCCVLFAALAPAQAAIIYNFKDAAGTDPVNLSIDQIQYYHGGDASGANVDGRYVNTEPGITLLADDDQKHAKTLDTLPSARFAFGAWDVPAGSKTLKVRIWDGEAQTAGGKYTALVSKSNPTGQTDDLVFKINYAFIFADPTKPVIYEVVESTTKPLPAGETIGSATIKSQATAHSSGLVIEIGQYEWTVNGEVDSSQTGANLVLSTPQYSLNLGDTYTVSVRYKNLWSKWGPSSDSYTHVVAGGAEGGSTFIFDLKASEADRLVVNSIAVPSQNLSDGTVSLASELAGYINGQAGKVIVTAVYRYDAAAAQGFGITFDAGGQVSAGDDFEIVPGIGYQVYTTEDINVTFAGQ
jgi:hypothetical protein